MHTAVCLSNGKLDQSGFETEELAMSYICGLICNKCNSDLEMGYYFIEKNSDEKAIVNNVLETDCGAEWIIVTDEEYDESDTLEDLFIAFGLTPSDQETEDNLTYEQLEKMQKKQEELERKRKSSEGE